MDTTPEMVRRVAEAMLEGYQRAVVPSLRSDGWKPTPFSEIGGLLRGYYYAAAREAIQAMREPTEAQRLAAYEAVELDDRWDIHDDERWANSWRAGIDAALAVPGEGKD